MKETEFGFLGIGALYEDTLLSLPHYPKEDEKLRATDLVTRVGGNVPNTLQVLSQMRSPEDRLIFISTFAEKAASKRLTDVLAKKFVEVEGVWRDCPDNPSSWILRSDQNGSRTIVNYNNVDEFTSEQLVHAVSTLSHKDSIKWIHFEGRIPAVLRASIPKIRNLFPWAKISIEFEKPDRPGLLDLLPYADIAFFSHAHLQHFQQKHKDPNLTAFYYFNTLRHRNTFAIFVLMAGKEGAFYSAKGEDGAVPTTEVDVVDATGAGDTFIAGFIWAKAKLGKSVKDSVTDAVSLATAKVAQEGFDELWDNGTKKS